MLPQVHLRPGHLHGHYPGHAAVRAIAPVSTPHSGPRAFKNRNHVRSLSRRKCRWVLQSHSLTPRFPTQADGFFGTVSHLVASPCSTGWRTHLGLDTPGAGVGHCLSAWVLLPQTGVAHTRGPEETVPRCRAKAAPPFEWTFKAPVTTAAVSPF